MVEQQQEAGGQDAEGQEPKKPETNSAADQQTMSEAEFRGKEGLNAHFAGIMTKTDSEVKEAMESLWSKQAVNRLEESAKRAGVTPVELIAKWVRTA